MPLSEFDEKRKSGEPEAAGGPMAVSASAGASGDRDSQGRWQAGNAAALVHGARSRQASALQAPLRAEIRQRVLSDLGVQENELASTMLALVDRFSETSLLCSAYFTWLEDQGGPIGTRGRQRAAVGGYLAALDRQMKLATLIGLQRRARRVPSLDEVMNGRD